MKLHPCPSQNSVFQASHCRATFHQNVKDWVLTYFHLALSQECVVYAWGVNTMGQCGQGHVNSPIVRPVKVKMSLDGVPVHQISAGTSHSMAWTTLPPDK